MTPEQKARIGLGQPPRAGCVCRDIIADLESALEQLRLIAEDVGVEDFDDAKDCR